MSSQSDPARKLKAIVPHDTNELSGITRGIFVGGDGDLTLIAAGDTESETLYGLTAGTLLPIEVKVVLTSSTATNLVGFY